MVNYSRHDVEALAPGGTLRATINLGNPILASQVPGQKPTGVSVDLATALASRLEVPLELVVLESAGKAVEAVRGDHADVGFFAVDPLRAQGIAFTAPYVLIEGSYLVREASPITNNNEVDRSGVKVVVGNGSAYDLFLTRQLKSAEIVRAPTSPAVVDMLVNAKLDVAAGVKQQLEHDAERISGLKLLPGRFMVIEQAMGLPLGRGELASFLLRQFVDQMKGSGFIHQALLRHQVYGAVVAPVT